MKMSRWFLLTSLALFLSVGFASAQWAVGVRGGAYMGTVTKPELLTTITPEFKWSPGVSSAVFAEYSLSDNVAIRPEILFQQKGFQMREGTSVSMGGFPVPIGVRSAYRVNYVETPVLLKLSTGGEGAQLYAIAGPSVGYATNAKLVTHPQAILDLRPIRTNVNLDAINYQRFEFSAVAGAGLSVKAGAGDIIAEARYQHGFTRLVDAPIVRANARNQGVSVSLGYKIPF
ncbi:porin family protein [Telluribacter sp. SYSU D00476]|uniref:porin family protein n=1 Tax=Telluribacter sp. SYSU D00476 TaxID=2811430 RepID=UPI001FF373E8|nr:porin family protein [Telluribacter sp. SYSU D00476]